MYALPRPVGRDTPKIITVLDVVVSSAYRFSKIFRGFGGRVEEGQWKLLQKWMKEGNTVHGNATSYLWFDLSSYSLSSTTETQCVVFSESHSLTLPAHWRTGEVGNDFPADFTGPHKSPGEPLRPPSLATPLLCKSWKSNTTHCNQALAPEKGRQYQKPGHGLKAPSVTTLSRGRTLASSSEIGAENMHETRTIF